MDLFQDIPQAIQTEILCQWLKQHEVAHLDSAVCSKTIRPIFLSVLRSDCVYPSLDTMYVEQTQWAIKRNYRLKALTLRHDTDSLTREKLLKNISLTLTEISLCGDEEEVSSMLPANVDETLFDIAMFCPIIRKLSAWNVIAASNLNLVLIKCAQLNDLHLNSCTGITSSTVKSICNSTSLNYVELEESEFVTDTPDFSTYKSALTGELHICDLKISRAVRIKLCACFPFLTIFSAGPVSGDDLVTIATSCPHVKATYICVQGVLSSRHAAQLCSHWPNLELLQFENEFGNRAACSEEAVLILLKGCTQLLKLAVCALDYPHSPDYLYGSGGNAVNKSTIQNTAPLANSVSTTAIATEATASKVTDLFLESASEATLRVILTLCPQLNTLAIRHCVPVKPTHNATSDSQRAAEYVLSCLNHPTCSVRKLHLHNIRSLEWSDLQLLTCLEELQLSKVGNKLSDESILSIVKNNPNLCSISLYKCELLRGRSLILPLLKLCPDLHTFNFTECNAEDGKSNNFSSAVDILEDVIIHSFPNIQKLNLSL